MAYNAATLRGSWDPALLCNLVREASADPLVIANGIGRGGYTLASLASGGPPLRPVATVLSLPAPPTASSSPPFPQSRARDLVSIRRWPPRGFPGRAAGRRGRRLWRTGRGIPVQDLRRDPRRSSTCSGLDIGTPCNGRGGRGLGVTAASVRAADATGLFCVGRWMTVIVGLLAGGDINLQRYSTVSVWAPAAVTCPSAYMHAPSVLVTYQRVWKTTEITSTLASDRRMEASQKLSPPEFPG